MLAVSEKLKSGQMNVSSAISGTTYPRLPCQWPCQVTGISWLLRLIQPEFCKQSEIRKLDSFVLSRISIELTLAQQIEFPDNSSSLVKRSEYSPKFLKSTTVQYFPSTSLSDRIQLSFDWYLQYGTQTSFAWAASRSDISFFLSERNLILIFKLKSPYHYLSYTHENNLEKTIYIQKSFHNQPLKCKCSSCMTLKIWKSESHTN